MCGITGIVGRTGRFVADEEITKMTAAIAHRGPDGDGFFHRNNVAFGHRRLAIIDLEAGKQPMSNEDGAVWITFNGEIYNYRDLRSELMAHGHCFRTNSDTEVIVHAYEQWGITCVNRLRGMFAFGIADLNKRKLFLARDHFGIKPLFYRLGKDYIAFASELSALRMVNDDTPNGNLQAIEMYLRYQYIPSPMTIYREIFKLCPAHYVYMSFDDPAPKAVRYWDIQFEHPNNRHEDESNFQAQEVIRDSVQAHLVSDVPFGVFLSGGIDSTLVALNMSKILKQPVKAFSIGFNEKEFSELDYAKTAANRLGVEHHFEIVTEDSLGILEKLIVHYGEPFGDSSAIPTYYVSKLAREFVPMVLSGDGGDELFAGYTSYLRWMSFDPWKTFFASALKLKPKLTRKSLKEALKYRSLNNFFGDRHHLAEWMKFMFFINEHGRKSIWKKDYLHLIEDEADLFVEASVRAQPFDRLSYAQYVDINTYLHGDILTKVDVASMAHGLEVRTPLIDLRVLEFASTLPLDLKYRRINGNYVGKYILKGMLSEYFDHKFIYRKKQGFALPRETWFLNDRKSRDFVGNLILTESARINRFFTPEAIRQYYNTHGEPHNFSGILWLLIVLEIWLQQNKEVAF